MIRTGAALAAVLAAAGLPAVASAAPAKAACQLLVDAAGDGTTSGVVPHRDALDILSADVASGPRNLVGALRLASTASDPTLTHGVTYSLSWTAGGTTQLLSYAVFQDGTTSARFDPRAVVGDNGPTHTVKVVVDPATSTITWTVPRKLNPVLAKRGAKFTQLAAASDPKVNLRTPAASPVQFNGESTLASADDASGGKAYTDFAPSCVKGV